MTRARRFRLAIWKLASCDGCQLRLLEGGDDLLALAETVEIARFEEASSAVGRGPYDLSLVEGSVSTPRDAARVRRIRRASRHLVTIGACATAGGIQALRNVADVGTFAAAVYPTPAYVETLARSSAVAEHVPVDFELHGCPVDREQLLMVVAAFVHGRRPTLPSYSVCVECKRRAAVCVLVAHGMPCLGPVTRAGCGAICPAFARGCYGCFGPAETTNTDALADELAAHGMSDAALVRAFRSFNADAPAFRAASARRDPPR